MFDLRRGLFRKSIGNLITFHREEALPRNLNGDNLAFIR